MSGFEFNKLLGAVLLATLIALLSGFVAGQLVPDRTPEKPAYVIAGVPEAPPVGGSDAATPASAVPTPAEVAPVGALLASADPAAGEKIAAKCAACHTFGKGDPAKVGPNLYGIVDNRRAHMDGFNYSDAMKTAGGTWSYEELNKFIASPKNEIKGTRMSFPGLPDAKDRANVIAWLRTKADSPAPLP